MDLPIVLTSTTCHARTPLARWRALILATTLLWCVSGSGALAADLTLFEGTWNGIWERTSDSDPQKGTKGDLVTTFTVRNNRLEGTHYNIKIEEVEVEGREVLFKHPYGSCRASHWFTVDAKDPRMAESKYEVENCADPTQNHAGKITYTKTQ
jgi:hypothetical protein